MMYSCKLISLISSLDRAQTAGYAERIHTKNNPPSLIRVFAVHMKKALVLSYPISAERWLWSALVDAQADLTLCWALSHFVGFVMLQLICPPPLRLRYYKQIENTDKSEYMYMYAHIENRKLFNAISKILYIPYFLSPGPEAQSYACQTGIQVTSSILLSGNILSWRLVMKSFLWPFSPNCWFK